MQSDLKATDIGTYSPLWYFHSRVSTLLATPTTPTATAAATATTATMGTSFRNALHPRISANSIWQQLAAQLRDD
ncbi:hypothetical protein V1477_003507 [Vespula maculifrons]|uniref:Uncharacterized protein n=2 Tax=Vespula TaxID=7451 RepID=A0A834NDC0_VESVU|nr:hypothetical protein HZH66_003716 [Vespula vulgaris]